MVFRISDIHIVQSLREDDRPTGWQLYEHIRPLVPRPSPLDVVYRSVTTRAGLFLALTAIADHMSATNRTPLLHLETHGGHDGLELTSGELVPWKDLHPYLVMLNHISRLNLVVVVMACEGLDLLHAFDYAKRAPAGLVIGPHRDVLDTEVARGTRAFYTTMFAALHVGQAFRAMNAAVNAMPPELRGGDEDPFTGMDAERLFRWVMEGYAEQFTKGAALTQRIDRLTARVTARCVREGMRLTEAERGNIRRNITIMLTNHGDQFEGRKNHFFFVDVCPENAERFAVRFEDCFHD